MMIVGHKRQRFLVEYGVILHMLRSSEGNRSEVLEQFIDVLFKLKFLFDYTRRVHFVGACIHSSHIDQHKFVDVNIVKEWQQAWSKQSHRNRNRNTGKFQKPVRIHRRKYDRRRNSIFHHNHNDCSICKGAHIVTVHGVRVCAFCGHDHEKKTYGLIEHILNLFGGRGWYSLPLFFRCLQHMLACIGFSWHCSRAPADVCDICATHVLPNTFVWSCVARQVRFPMLKEERMKKKCSQQIRYFRIGKFNFWISVVHRWSYSIDRLNESKTQGIRHGEIVKPTLDANQSKSAV